MKKWWIYIIVTKFCEIAYLVIYLSCKDESLKNTWLTSEVFAYSKPEWKIGFWDKACWTGFFYIFCHFFWHIWWFYKYLDCDYWLLSPKYAKNQNLQNMLLIQLSPFFGWFLVLIGIGTRKFYFGYLILYYRWPL